jgi:hypothetical protein
MEGKVREKEKEGRGEGKSREKKEGRERREERGGNTIKKVHRPLKKFSNSSVFVVEK